MSGHAGEDEAEGSIGPIACLAFAVGSMVGGGVFTLSGTAINEAGPSALVSYLIAACVMLLSALSFVAVAARAKPGDSGYGPVGELLGPAWRFLVMWGFYVNGLMLLTFLLISFGDYLHEYFLSGLDITIAGLIAIAGLTALNLGPSDLVGKAETTVVAAKVALLLVFVAWGLAEISHAHFTPFAPEGVGGTIRVSALLFTAYTGFNVVTNMASAVRRPERTVPFAVIGSVLVSATIYVGVILAMLASGVQHFGPAGVGEAAEALMGNAGGLVIAFAACLSTLSGANANLLGASEVTLRLVAQGDVPPVAGRTTARGHPYVSVLLIGAVAAVLVLVGDVNSVVTYANVGALVSMVVMNVAAFRLARQGWPGRGLRIPGGAVTPVVAALACLAQFPSLGWLHVGIGLLLVASGLLLYLARHHQQGGGHAAHTAAHAVRELATPLARSMRRVGSLS